MHQIIPETHNIYKKLYDLIQTRSVLVFSWIPWVGKSLYINQARLLAEKLWKDVHQIQRDVARQCFEHTDICKRDFPEKDWVTHPAIRLMTWKWCFDIMKEKLDDTKDDIRIIEAPLIWNRMSELISLWSTYKDDLVFVIPCPSKNIREELEMMRRQDVDETNGESFWAKPSVMIWVYTYLCEIAELLWDAPVKSNTWTYIYDPKILKSVYSYILWSTSFVYLDIDTLFDIWEIDDEILHSWHQIVPNLVDVTTYIQRFQKEYAWKDVNEIVSNWRKK